MTRHTIRTTDFDKLAASSPLNRTAAVVRDSVSPEYEEPAGGEQRFHGLAPPPMRPADKVVPKWADMIGRRYNRFTVIGQQERKGSRMVVRCDCGYYEVRRPRAILDNLDRAMCTACDKLEEMKQHGGNPSKRLTSAEKWAADRVKRTHEVA